MTQKDFYELTKLMFTDLRVRRLEMAKKKRILLTLMRPHTFVCCVCFSVTYVPSPAGRLSDVVDLTARRLGIHIKTPPGDTPEHTRTAERQVKGLFLVFYALCKDGRVHPHITAAKRPQPVFPPASSDVALPDSGQVTPCPPATPIGPDLVFMPQRTRFFLKKRLFYL